MLTEARASTAQLGYWSLDGNIFLMKFFTKSGNRPSIMLCLAESIRVSYERRHSVMHSGDNRASS